MMQFSPMFPRFLGALERCVLHPYHGKDDPPGVDTIYWGHVIRPGDVFKNTQEDADAYLKRDLKWVVQWLWRHCPWTTGPTKSGPVDDLGTATWVDLGEGRQHNFDACCSLVYNAGHIFDDVLEEVNGANRPDVVKALWMSHCRASGGAEVLKIRRAKEVAFYLTPDPPLFDEQAVANTLASVYTTSSQILAEDGFIAA